MKFFILVLTIALFPVADAAAQVKAPAADEVLEAAYARASAGNKNVLLIFHASWCGWCRKMDSSLHDAAIKPAIDRSYEIAHLTVYESPTKKALENPGALDFLAKNNGAEKGLPFWYVLDKTGVVLASSEMKTGQNSGCPATAEEVAHFIDVLKKTSSLKDAELEAVQKRFRRNE